MCHFLTGKNAGENLKAVLKLLVIGWRVQREGERVDGGETLLSFLAVIPSAFHRGQLQPFPPRMEGESTYPDMKSS